VGPFRVRLHQGLMSSSAYEVPRMTLRQDRHSGIKAPRRNLGSRHAHAGSSRTPSKNRPSTPRANVDRTCRQATVASATALSRSWGRGEAQRYPNSRPRLCSHLLDIEERRRPGTAGAHPDKGSHCLIASGLVRHKQKRHSRCERLFCLSETVN